MPRNRKQKIDTFSGEEPENEKTMPTPTDKKRMDGKYEDYWILTEGEHERPVRKKYVHQRCGDVTTIHQKIAETFARDPKFYGSTYCCTCKDHYPVYEFNWLEDNKEVGS